MNAQTALQRPIAAWPSSPGQREPVAFRHADDEWEAGYVYDVADAAAFQRMGAWVEWIGEDA